MVSKSNIRNYKSRKCNSRFKNKNKNKKNTKMIGGSNNGFVTTPGKTNIRYDLIEQKFHCINRLHKNYKVSESGNFEIRKCKIITPYFLYKNDILLYIEKPSQDKLESTHTFAVHEYSNQSMNIQYLNTSTGIQTTFNIRLIDLNVDTMQLALNSGCLDVISDPEPNSNVYISFNNFNCLSVNRLSNPFVYTSRNKSAWFDVYEDYDTITISDNKFDIIDLGNDNDEYVLLQQFLEYNRNRHSRGSTLIFHQFALLHFQTD
jgi:hypothetical protein